MIINNHLQEDRQLFEQLKEEVYKMNIIEMQMKEKTNEHSARIEGNSEKVLKNKTTFKVKCTHSFKFNCQQPVHRKV